jgi:small GTP-binding protein
MYKKKNSNSKIKKEKLFKYNKNKLDDNDEKDNKIEKKERYSNIFIKLLVLGDSGVGKSTLISRFLNSYITNKEDAKNSYGKCKISFEKNIKNIKIDNILCQFQIWEPTLKQYNTLTKQFYRDSNGCILIYDITNENSFLNIKKIWLKDIYENFGKNFPIIILGNKKDLNSKREVSIDKVISFCKENFLEYYEISAFFNSEVIEIFKNIGIKILQNDEIVNQNSKGISIDYNTFYKEKNNTCNC